MRHEEKKAIRQRPAGLRLGLVGLALGILLLAASGQNDQTVAAAPSSLAVGRPVKQMVLRGDSSSRRDDAGAQAAFLAAYAVFKHPRCMNCHPAGNAPLQGERSVPHAMRVQRGLDGKGLVSMRCGSCHQSKNQPGEHAPPGAEDWHLPTAKTPMVFEKKTAGQLCRQFRDARKTGGRTANEVLEHLSTDLVVWAWKPGDGRSTPPLSHADFVRKLQEWVDKGCGCPEN